MRKYISVLLGCFLMAVLLIPGAYSLWRKDINAIGTVEISVDKNDTYPLENNVGESIMEATDKDKLMFVKETQEVDGSVKTCEPEDADKPEDADEAEEKNTVEMKKEEKVKEAVKVKEN